MIAAALSIGAWSALGQDTNQPVYTLEDLTISGRAYSDTLGIVLDPVTTPITLSSVSADLNRRQNSLTLRDALSNVSGVNAGTGNGVHDFFVIRGIDSLSGGLVLTDGIPEPEATFYPMHNIESVEVVKGPTAFLVGANALAGSVNMVRKRPVQGEFADIRVGIGSRETFRLEYDGGTYWAWKDAALRLNGLYHQADSHRDEVESEIWAVNPSLSIRLGNSDTLRLDVDVQQNDVTPDAGVPVLGNQRTSSSRSLTFQDPSDFSEQDVFRALLTYRHECSDTLDLRNRTYVTALDWMSVGTVYAGYALFGAGFEPAPVTLSRYRPSLDDEQVILGNELEVSVEFDTGPVKHRALGGIELTRFTDELLLEVDPTTDISTQTRLETPGILPPLPTNTADAESDIFSLYAIDQIMVGPAWSVLLGARADWLDFEDTSRSTSRSDNEVSPFGGITYRPIDPMSVYVSAGTAFGPPSTQVAGPRGEPETSEQVEAGVKWANVDQRWTGHLAAFAIDRDNIAIPDSSGLFSENGKQESRGIEFEVMGYVVAGWRIRFSYAYTDSELSQFTEITAVGLADQSGNTAPFAPENIVNFWTDYDLTESVGLGLGVRGVSEQFIAPDNQYEIEGYVTLDAAVYYDQPTWYASLHVLNLTDETYYTRGQGNTSVIPEDGVSVMGYVGVRL